MRVTPILFALSVTTMSCREDHPRGAPPSMPTEAPVADPDPAGARVSPAPTRSGTVDTTMRPEVDVAAPTVLNLDQIKWMAAPPALPKGAQIAVLEGAPPFPADKTFTIVAKLPKNYIIPPHTHLVTERVTVLKGALSFGHGAKLDRASATKVKAGGLVLIPAGHEHFAFTTDQETVITLNGIGPWEIIYLDPKDDPRPTPVRKPDTMPTSRWESAAEAKIVQAADVSFVEPPAGMMHAGAKMAVLEGDPNEPKLFTLRLHFPKGYDVRPHMHSTTERFMIVGGSGTFGLGTVRSKAERKLSMGAIGVLPKDAPHYALASPEGLTVQVTGVGPFDLKYAHPEDVPPK